MTTGPYGIPFTAEWRLAHAEAGDDLLAQAVALGKRGVNANAPSIVTAIAQAHAHYAAANVRARPPQPAEAGRTDRGEIIWSDGTVTRPGLHHP